LFPVLFLTDHLRFGRPHLATNQYSDDLLSSSCTLLPTLALLFLQDCVLNCRLFQLDAASPNIPTPFEADILRRTLTELLKENEALRLALQASSTADEMALTAELSKPRKEAPVQPQASAPLVPSTKRVLDTEARKIALERYRIKRQKRIAKTPHLQGPKFMKYTKMKKVADSKRRNSAGKFIKKADLENMRLAEEASQRAIEEEPTTLVQIPLCHQLLVS
jgi:hypothetical protein